MYAISSDGLIFRVLSKIHSKFRTPLLATILSGLFAGTSFYEILKALQKFYFIFNSTLVIRGNGYGI